MSADEIVFRSPASVLQAASVALVGASERGKWPRLIHDNLRMFGYAGRVFLVNPRQSEVYGERCFPSLRDCVCGAYGCEVRPVTPVRTRTPSPSAG